MYSLDIDVGLFSPLKKTLRIVGKTKESKALVVQTRKVNGEHGKQALNCSVNVSLDGTLLRSQSCYRVTLLAISPRTMKIYLSRTRYKPKRNDRKQ